MCSSERVSIAIAVACMGLLCSAINGAIATVPELGSTRVVFQVDKGFVAQVADVTGGRTAPMNEVQKLEAGKTIVGEFSDVKHVRGILSMGRYSDPDSAQSSFSILLGDAPHLDGEYAIFGKVTKGDETLRKLEQVPTRKEGIFVMCPILVRQGYLVDTARICALNSVPSVRQVAHLGLMPRWGLIGARRGTFRTVT
ncbi:hypothetical protein DH2020_026943 [Rehmannia glutinosa]|uniref:PPIase cyclophilin-type domain-containing protein n=1 Tax=Rehmannia glutinosa TaxID=99300 RepID=A0ABR0VXA5_REHGL